MRLADERDAAQSGTSEEWLGVIAIAAVSGCAIRASRCPEREDLTPMRAWFPLERVSVDDLGHYRELSRSPMRRSPSSPTASGSSSTAWTPRTELRGRAAPARQPRPACAPSSSERRDAKRRRRVADVAAPGEAERLQARDLVRVAGECAARGLRSPAWRIASGSSAATSASTPEKRVTDRGEKWAQWPKNAGRSPAPPSRSRPWHLFVPAGTVVV